MKKLLVLVISFLAFGANSQVNPLDSFLLERDFDSLPKKLIRYAEEKELSAFITEGEKEQIIGPYFSSTTRFYFLFPDSSVLSTSKRRIFNNQRTIYNELEGTIKKMLSKE